jgi:predicted PolB exonuclease-like 3'-5' exonuclease
MANMISKDTLKKILYFDIETAGIQNTFTDLVESDPRLAKIWDKRCTWLRKNSGEEYKDATPDRLWLDKSSLHPEFAKIVCISFGAYSGDDVKIQSIIGDENELLSNANKIFNNAVTKGWKLGGHTIKNFDIPFVGKRMIINKIDPSPIIGQLNRKPWDSPVIDISEVFAFGGYGQTHSSLDLMCSVLGHESPKDDMDGSMVHPYFHSGRIDEIKKYCEMDVKYLMKCYESFSFE